MFDNVKELQWLQVIQNSFHAEKKESVDHFREKIYFYLNKNHSDMTNSLNDKCT